MKNKNKNMNNLFKENWFIFDNSEKKPDEVKGESTEGVTKGPQAAVDAATKSKEGGKVETTKKSSEKRETFNTQVKLDTLKSKINKATINEILSNVSFKYEFNKDNYTDSSVLESKIKSCVNISPKQEVILKPLIEKFFKIEGSLSELLEDIIAISVSSDVFDKLNTDYPEIYKFGLFKQGLAKVDMDIDFDSGGTSEVKLTCNKQTEFDAFKVTATTKVKEKQKGETETQTKVSIEESINKHPFGSFILGFISGEPEGGGDSTLTKLSKGTAPFWSFILGLIGVGHFKGSYEKAKKMAARNPKSKSIFDRLEKAVKGIKPKDEKSSETASKDLEVVDKKTFINIVNGSTKATKKFKLKEGISVSSLRKEGKLKVDLGTSENITVAKNTILSINNINEQSTDANTVVKTGGEHEISGIIPAGTVFSSGVVFKTA